MKWLPWFRRRREQTLNDELASYLELAAEDRRGDGASEEEARFAARRDLGSTLRTQEDVRAEWIPAFMEHLVQDLRFSARSLRKSPLFTGIAIITLALGIGAANAIFALVDGVLLKPLAYRQSGQLLYVQEVVPAMSNVYPKLPVNFQHFTYWREHVRTFQGLCAFRAASYTLTGSGTPEQIDAVDTTAGLFDVLQTRMQQGRGFLRGEDQPGKASVAVITDSLWHRRFGGRRIVGHLVQLNGLPVTVIGILPADFHFPKASDLGALTSLGKRIDVFRPVSRWQDGWDGDYDFAVFGRLRSGLPQAQGLAELTVLTKQMIAAHQIESQPHPVAMPLQEAISGGVTTSLLVALGAVLVLLLIVCLNLANLMMARAQTRHREFSVRAALGANQRRLVQQLLTEAMLLSSSGALLGVLISTYAVRLFALHAAVEMPRLDEVHVDARVMLFSLALTLGCACLFGLAPAWRVTRSNLQDAMRSSGPATTANKESLRWRQVLVGMEVALSTVLIFLAGLLISSLTHLLQTDKGFRNELTLTTNISLPGAQYASDATRVRFFDRTLSSVRAVPGVESAAFIAGLPLTGESEVNSIQRDGARGDWLDPASKTAVMINVRFISPGYFETIGIPVLQGTSLTEQDRNGRVAIVSARLAEKVWPGQSPIGRKFKTGSGVDEVRVIGVVRDTYNARLDGEPTLIAYVPSGIRPPRYTSLVVRTALDSDAFLRTMQRLIWSSDTSLLVAPVKTMSEWVSESLAQRRLQVDLASAFGLGALMLALIGVYGVLAYSVEQRRTELGLRLALGAKRSELIWLTLKQGLLPVAGGLVCGLVLSVALGGFVRSLLFGVAAADPLTIALVVALLAATAFAACLIPARKASLMNPASILRHQ